MRVNPFARSPWLVARPMRAVARSAEGPVDLVELRGGGVESPLRFPPDVPGKRELLDRFVRVDNVSPAAREVLYRDLSVLPEHVLRLLGDDRLTVVALAPGQTLADTAFLPHLSEEEYQQAVTRARAALREAASQIEARWEPRLRQLEGAGESDGLPLAMARYGAARELAEATRGALAEAGLAFQVDLLHESFELEKLARDHGLQDPTDFDRWCRALQALNGDRIRLEGGRVEAEGRVVLVPYPYHRGAPVPEQPWREAASRTEANVADSLGLHDASRRLVMLTEAYVADPAPELGHYRIAIHEVGHAIDHALDRRLGRSHRERIERWYREDLELARKGGPNRFLTDRAGDNAREYFAEAVEAYFTRPTQDAYDGCRSRSHYAALRDTRPELFHYLEQLFDTRRFASLAEGPSPEGYMISPAALPAGGEGRFRPPVLGGSASAAR